MASDEGLASGATGVQPTMLLTRASHSWPAPRLLILITGIGIAVLTIGVMVAALVASGVAPTGRHGPAPAAAATTDEPVHPS